MVLDWGIGGLGHWGIGALGDWGIEGAIGQYLIFMRTPIYAYSLAAEFA